MLFIQSVQGGMISILGGESKATVLKGGGVNMNISQGSQWHFVSEPLLNPEM